MIIAVNFQFKQLERRSLKKIRASSGFEPVTSAITGAMLYQQALCRIRSHGTEQITLGRK